MTAMTSNANTPRTARALAAAASLALLGCSAMAQAPTHDAGHGHAEGHGQYAHVHGVVQLDVAVDGADVVVQLTAPQSDITGFERAARTDAEKQTVTDAVAKLKLPELFAINTAAGCELASTDIHGLGPTAHGHTEHSHQTDTQEQDHGHAHAAKADKTDGHGHAASHDHKDVTVHYQWHCKSADTLESIDVQLAKHFPSIHTINVQMALPQGQFSRTLKTGQTRLTWN